MQISYIGKVSTHARGKLEKLLRVVISKALGGEIYKAYGLGVLSPGCVNNVPGLNTREVTRSPS
eukprot:snap_masked-scaffold_58-processed-gene-0.68-mRNA-1 protein AED:1.00 eAED:1.00 QI:0/0/0/0/1/1/2/0/63